MKLALLAALVAVTTIFGVVAASAAPHPIGGVLGVFPAIRPSTAPVGYSSGSTAPHTSPSPTLQRPSGPARATLSSPAAAWGSYQPAH